MTVSVDSMACWATRCALNAAIIDEMSKALGVILCVTTETVVALGDVVVEVLGAEVVVAGNEPKHAPSVTDANNKSAATAGAFFNLRVMCRRQHQGLSLESTLAVLAQPNDIESVVVRQKSV